jgi:hypothetical protein
MRNWQERITRETAPAILVEHELRYRAAAPLISSAGAWADLGCGNGLAAAAALGEVRPTAALLVDVDESAVVQAAHELTMPTAHQLAADLTERSDLERIGDLLVSLPGPPVLTCFEVVEHLSSFVHLLEWSSKLVAEHGASFVMSVPNDSFWSIQNPHHMTAWGDGAFEELRRLLPAERTLMRQVALAGSALLGWRPDLREHAFSAEIGGEGTVATHFIAAFGPLHAKLWRGAVAAQTDVNAQRCWERERDSEVAVAIQIADENRSAVRRMEKTIADQANELRAHTRQFEEWRSYIHELEHELGKPLAGTREAAAAAAASAGAVGPAEGAGGAPEARAGNENAMEAADERQAPPPV